MRPSGPERGHVQRILADAVGGVGVGAGLGEDLFQELRVVVLGRDELLRRCRMAAVRPSEEAMAYRW